MFLLSPTQYILWPEKIKINNVPCMCERSLLNPAGTFGVTRATFRGLYIFLLFDLALAAGCTGLASTDLMSGDFSCFKGLSKKDREIFCFHLESKDNHDNLQH